MTYAYDNAGNITSVSDGSKTITYTYDLLGQLIRVNDPYDPAAGTSGTTWVYEYDLGGNIQKKTAYAYTSGNVGSAVQTNTYTYGDSAWKDKLTAFNGVGISYDEIGNPLYDGTWSYSWTKGRQLQSMSKGGENVSYTYNEDGMRIQKVSTVSGTTSYTMYNKNIVQMENNSDILHFFYDAQNRPAVVVFNGIAYGYLYNLHGDIVALTNSAGNIVVKYAYDAWGNILSTSGALASTLGALNPFRYRGYIYDEETALYYLSCRYYSPKYGRFISSDEVDNLGANSDLSTLNLFSYCGNNPIARKDVDGQFWDIIFDVASLVCSAVEVITNPTDVTAWLGLAGDVVDLIPGLTGVGETVRALRTTGKIVEGSDTVIDSYKALRKLNKGNGMEVHHIIEKRFAKSLGIDNTDEMLSIALTKAEHLKYTNDWRNTLRRGRTYTREQILEAATVIYSDRPDLLGAAWMTLMK